MAKAAVDFVALTVRLKCECENWNFGGAVEQRSSLLAAKRRKNAAHGASRGNKWEAEKPQRGERPVLTHTLNPRPFKTRSKSKAFLPIASEVMSKTYVSLGVSLTLWFIAFPR